MKTSKTGKGFVILLFLSIISVLFNKAFLLNPFIMIVLYFSFYYGLKSYLVNSFVMIIVAMLFSFNYCLEIMVVIISYLFSTSLFSLLIKKPESKFYSLITMNVFFFIVALIFDYKVETICMAFVNAILQFVVINAFESVFFIKNKPASIVQKAIVIAFLGIIGTFLEPIGLWTIRVVLIFAAMKLKNEIGALSVFITAMYVIVFLDYGFISIASLFLPLFLVLILPKYNIFAYLFSSIALLLFSPTPLYLNVSFYATLGTMIIFLTIGNSKLDVVYDFFNSFDKRKNEVSYLSYANGQIQALNNYLSLVNEVDSSVIINPFDSLILDVRKNVCEKCDHKNYCSLKNELHLLFKDKQTTQERKMITEKCISPYKLTMALNSNFKVYQKEQMYFDKCQEAKDRYRFLLRSIEKPIKTCSLKIKNNSNIIEQKILESGLHYYQFWTTDRGLEVIFNIDTFDDDDMKFEEYIKYNLDSYYKKIIHKQNILTSTIQVSYLLLDEYKYDLGIITKSFDDNYNGDAYLIKKKKEELYIVLSDGMGHGLSAEKCSKFLISAVEAHISMNSDLSDMMQDLNNLLLFRNEEDDYATMDFVKINLSSLKTKIIKAGSFLSYIIRNNKIIKINKHNLPLGIVSECDYETSDFVLKKDDVLIIVSDGLGEKIEIDEKILLITPDVTMDHLVRNIYNAITKKETINDDATIIALKIL